VRETFAMNAEAGGVGKKRKALGGRRGDKGQRALRGDVLRKVFTSSKGGSKGKDAARACETYSEFFSRVDAGSEIIESREWLSNKDDLYLVYCHLTGAGFAVEGVLIGQRARAYYIVASRVSQAFHGRIRGTD